MASIQSKTDSKGKKRYYVVFRDPQTGKQKWKAAGLRKSDAERLLCEVAASVARQKLLDSSRVSFSDFCALWLETYAKPRYSPSSYESTLKRIRGHLIPFFGKALISSIASDDITGFIEHRRCAGAAAPTVARDLAPLKAILGCAHKWGYIRTDPSSGIQNPRSERVGLVVLSTDELEALFEAAVEPCTTIFMMAAYVGLRRGELLALTWGDIDWDNDEVVVSKTAFRGETIPLRTHEVRRIPLPARLKQALRTHAERRPGGPGDPVFVHPDGRRIDANNLTRRTLKRALQKAGLPDMRFCDLRHTYAAHLLGAGASIETLQARLGHSSSQTTRILYGHMLEGE